MGEQKPDTTQGKTQDPNKLRRQKFISRKQRQMIREQYVTNWR